jgi:predicted nucleotidyltransferase
VSLLSSRRSFSEQKLNLLRAELAEAERIISGKACVYATGSFGRLEATSQSDLDVFIVSKTAFDRTDGKDLIVNQLSNLDSILVKAELIKAISRLEMPNFDADGKYLECHTVDRLKDRLGTSNDDHDNTLTGRLLLFLESRPLIGSDVYSDVIDDVIAAYWRDYDSHTSDFIPAFLTNDILRLWRTFCVNYESGRRSNQDSAKIKNHKLKHSRMLTCYSALIYLLAVHKINGTVSPQDAREMTSLTPTDRLEWLRNQEQFLSVSHDISKALSLYSEFLDRMDHPKDTLKSMFAENSRDWITKSYEFGDTLFRILTGIGKDSKFYRLIVV